VVGLGVAFAFISQEEQGDRGIQAGADSSLKIQPGAITKPAHRDEAAMNRAQTSVVSSSE